MAPECIRNKQTSKASDIWSLGVLIYEMATGRAPFETHPSDPAMTEELTMNRIMEGDLNVPLKLSPLLRSLIESVLRGDPTSRPTLADIEGSEWMQQHRESGVEISKRIWQYWL